MNNLPTPLRQWSMYQPATEPFPSTPLGPSPTILLLGEAPGADEEKADIPFIGASGRLLKNQLLAEAGFNPLSLHYLNVFTKRPPENDLKAWTVTKTEHKKLFGVPPPNFPPPLAKRYLHPDHHWHLAELTTRLADLRPDFIICLGATALWAVTGDSGIANGRGVIFKTPWGKGIATYHPAAVLREWSLFPLAWADLVKGRLYLEGNLPAPLRRRIWINPSWAEIELVYNRFLRNPLWELGVDIETCPSVDQITTISFGTATESICLPLWDRHAPSVEKLHYSATPADEVRMWRWIERFCSLPNPKVGQNFLYDMQYLLDAPLPLPVKNAIHDTAIMQHSYQPEFPKALGTLSSLYLNEPSWKQMRQAAKDAKVDE